MVWVCWLTTSVVHQLCSTPSKLFGITFSMLALLSPSLNWSKRTESLYSPSCCIIHWAMISSINTKLYVCMHACKDVCIYLSKRLNMPFKDLLLLNHYFVLIIILLYFFSQIWHTFLSSPMLLGNKCVANVIFSTYCSSYSSKHSIEICIPIYVYPCLPMFTVLTKNYNLQFWALQCRGMMYRFPVKHACDAIVNFYSPHAALKTSTQDEAFSTNWMYSAFFELLFA